MQIAEIMNRETVTVSPSDSLADAARALHGHKVSAVIVLDGDRPVGILTERDIVTSVVDGADPDTTLVSERMTPDLVSLPPDADSHTAASLMADHRIRHVPVVSDSALVGLVSLSEVTLPTTHRQPTSAFGTTGVVAHFRGPFADGPPPDALELTVPPLGAFRFRELRRMIYAGIVLVFCVLRGLARKLTHRGQSWVEAGCEGVVDGFEVLGPTFVKVGQLVASSPGLFPGPLSHACQRCLDEVPPFPGAKAREMIRRDLGRAPGEVFRSFDDTSLSAASIGQVHACVLPDGREAVIKLQRPDIREQMTTDLRILFRFAGLLQKYVTVAENANAVAIIEDLHSVTYQELNPALEAWRQDRFRSRIGAFGDNDYITAPEVYWDYCGPHMICMERVSGVPLDEFEILRERGIDGELALRRGCKVWLEALLIHGPFHGDMHAGNLWVLDDGRGAFLDFGIMGELTEDWRSFVKDILFTIFVDGDYLRVAGGFKRLGVIDANMATDDQIAQAMEMIVGPLLASSIADISLGDLLVQITEMAKMFGAVAPKELVLVGKQLLYIERYIKALAPEYLMVKDPWLVKNVFPDDAARKAAELGITFPE